MIAMMRLIRIKVKEFESDLSPILIDALKKDADTLHPNS